MQDSPKLHLPKASNDKFASAKHFLYTVLSIQANTWTNLLDIHVARLSDLCIIGKW